MLAGLAKFMMPVFFGTQASIPKDAKEHSFLHDLETLMEQMYPWLFKVTLLIHFCLG